MKVRKIQKSSLLILLCITSLSYNVINIRAIDVSDSYFDIYYQDIHAFQVTTIHIHAEGSQGHVEGASVNVSSIEGTFLETSDTWVTGITNSYGVLSVHWQAPDTDNEIDSKNVTLEAEIISGVDSTTIETNITVHPIDFALSEFEAYPLDEVYELHTATLFVSSNGTYSPIENATVNLSCDEGVFVATNTTSISENTGELTYVTVEWIANLSVVIENPLVVNFTAEISYTGKIVTLILNETITVNPIDFDSSTLILSDYDVGGDYPVTVTTTALGLYGPVSDAEVFVDALDGTFPNAMKNITGYTDINGDFVTEWTAPEVASDINITLTTIIRFPTTTLFKTINTTVLVRSFLHNFTQISLSADPLSATVGDLVDITLHTTNEIGLHIALANATFTAPGGEFVGSGTDTITVQTDETGTVLVVWDTSSLVTPIGGLSYQIDIELIKEHYITNNSAISIFVEPNVQKLETSSTTEPSTIIKGANVTITVYVTADSANIEGATVQIIALAGKFASSDDVVATLNTDASGMVEFVWITVDMTVTATTNYNFEILATLPGFDTSDVEYVSVIVNPSESETTTPTNGGGLSQNQMLGILLGAVGGLLVIGTIGYLIIRKKPVS